MPRVIDLLIRLRTVKWLDISSIPSSDDIKLAETYLKSVATLAEQVGNDNEARIDGAFFSPRSVFAADRELLTQEVVYEYQRLSSDSSNAYDTLYCKSALEWAALCDEQNPVTIGREQIFEPLVSLVERRIPAIPKKGYWTILGHLLPLFDWVHVYGRTSDHL